MKEQLSNCCKCQVNVDSSDEGTSCYVCSGCKRACDLFEETFELDEVIKIIGHLNMKKKHKMVSILCALLREYERLKRLDDNVKSKLIEFIEYRGLCLSSIIESNIALLESLLK
jgi:hypothetical protein